MVLAAGVALGLLGAAAVADLLKRQIFGVKPFDPPALFAAAALMIAAGLAAGWWPAQRAAAKNPVRALNDV